ncbi:hypothetical protein BDN72DRAFT_578089 [Pluteus cervinus]|uniref:Uncharacterized protein n=1 Tax=Pluteus cervinus TaxID=181527 RepID=A0ACD3AX19_9AGAR|nr:hypothetical protein BDN72DRAFT_578089 [Pluteus cervinus]
MSQDHEGGHLETSMTTLTASSSGSRASREYRGHSMSFELDLSPIIEDAQVFAMIDEMNNNNNNRSEEVLESSHDGDSEGGEVSPSHFADSERLSVSEVEAEVTSLQDVEPGDENKGEDYGCDRREVEFGVDVSGYGMRNDQRSADLRNSPLGCDEFGSELHFTGKSVEGPLTREPLLLPSLPINESGDRQTVEKKSSRRDVRDSGIAVEGEAVFSSKPKTVTTASYDTRVKHNSKESWWLHDGIQDLVNNGFSDLASHT